MPQLIHFIVLKIVTPFLGTQTFARGTEDLKGQRNSFFKDGIITIFFTVSMLGKRGKLYRHKNGGSSGKLTRIVYVARACSMT